MVISKVPSPQLLSKFVHLNIFHPIVVGRHEEIYKCTHDFPKIPIRKVNDSRNSYGHPQGHTYPTKPKALEASPLTEGSHPSIACHPKFEVEEPKKSEASPSRMTLRIETSKVV